MACALDWLRQKGGATYVLRGEALATTHEVNPGRPVSATIVDLHNRTLQQVVEALDWRLAPATPADTAILRESAVMNHALRQFVEAHGAGEAVVRVEW